MGIYVDGHLVHVASGTSLNTALVLTAGKHNTAVQEWEC